MSVSGPKSTPLLQAFDHRRSCYNLSNKSLIPHEELKQLVQDCLNVVPSAFNTQTTRLVVLVGQHHTKLWEIVGDALRNKIGAERYASGTESKIKAFGSAHGTIVFADDPKAVEGLRLKGGDLYGPKVRTVELCVIGLLTANRLKSGHINPTACISTSCGRPLSRTLVWGSTCSITIRL